MRTNRLIPLLALSLALSMSGFLGHARGSSGENGDFCCVCESCGSQNSTAVSQLAADVTCIDGVGGFPCATTCFDLGCPQATTVNGSCSEPAAALLCSDDGVMAPAASHFGLVALAVALSGCGAFYLRRRRR